MRELHGCPGVRVLYLQVLCQGRQQVIHLRHGVLLTLLLLLLERRLLLLQEVRGSHGHHVLGDRGRRPSTVGIDDATWTQLELRGGSLTHGLRGARRELRRCPHDS
jgi:hypothetical protein